MNTPVNFELAKLLKEKGWNTFTSSFWKYPNEVPSLHTGVFNYNNRVKEDGTELPAYSAPTIAEVLMWIWEKHNIWISVDRYLDPEESEDFRYGYMIYYIDDYFGRGYKTPSDSYQAGIEYVLNNLI